MAGIAPLQPQFVVLELSTGPPKYFLRHEAVRLLHLQHRAHVKHGVRCVAVRPHDHVRAAVPQPLIRAVLLQRRAIKSKRQPPFGTLAKIGFQHVVALL